MLRRTAANCHWFWSLYQKELSENLHHKRPEISSAYTRLSQGLDRIEPTTPNSELTPFEYALKQAVLPISDALPVPRSVDPCYLSVNGEPVPQTWKFLPNQQLHEHLCNTQLRWQLHPFEKLISPNPSGYMEPLGPVVGNEDLPYAVVRTPLGKLPLTMRFRSHFRFSSLQITNIVGDKHALAEDLRELLPTKRIIVRRDRIELHKSSYDVARLVQHYLFSLGY
eukprot:TRINITY_DN58616_c0_g1_i1.p1 TRINITY_DN58616_c0_g1~~TRINITY_DN58616_c0_g1_i1.p1  ORF type:complete len:224 (+),score=29.86 TRINITY_DN58616_c0_g1_i1:68-739(+)